MDKSEIRGGNYIVNQNQSTDWQQPKQFNDVNLLKQQIDLGADQNDKYKSNKPNSIFSKQ